MNQRGFATLEVILMVMVIGILASIAVPRFTSVTTAANTAKIQADLSTIDTAIAVYYMEHGSYPQNFPNDLSEYLQDATSIKPPSGKVFIRGTSDKEEKDIPKNAKYEFSDDKSRAVLKIDGTAKMAGDFTMQKSAKE